MRNGVLIEEGTPQDILTKYETDSLESAFLLLCYKQEHIMVWQFYLNIILLINKHIN